MLKTFKKIFNFVENTKESDNRIIDDSMTIEKLSEELSKAKNLLVIYSKIQQQQLNNNTSDFFFEYIINDKTSIISKYDYFSSSFFKFEIYLKNKNEDTNIYKCTEHGKNIEIHINLEIMDSEEIRNILYDYIESLTMTAENKINQQSNKFKNILLTNKINENDKNDKIERIKLEIEEQKEENKKLEKEIKNHKMEKEENKKKIEYLEKSLKDNEKKNEKIENELKEIKKMNKLKEKDINNEIDNDIKFY